MDVTLDKTDPEFWEDTPIGSIVRLTDKQSIDLSMEHGNLDGLSYTVKEIQRIRESNDVLTWLVMSLESNEDRIWLVVKIVDEELSVYAYFASEDFETGNRHDCMTHVDEDDEGEYLDSIWIFQVPDAFDPEEDELIDFMKDFDPLEMKYATAIEWSEDDTDIEYLVKKQGEMHGKVTEIPASDSDLYATVVEFQAEGAKNPEAMLLEVGDVDAEDGGLIRLLLGTEVRLSEIDVLRA